MGIYMCIYLSRPGITTPHGRQQWHQHSPVHSTCRPRPSLPKGSGSESWSQYQQALRPSVWSALLMLPVAIVGIEKLHRCGVVSPDAVHEIPGPELGVRWGLAD